jgi:hypothetical protein
LYTFVLSSERGRERGKQRRKVEIAGGGERAREIGKR